MNNETYTKPTMYLGPIYMAVEMGTLYPHLDNLYAKDIDNIAKKHFPEAYPAVLATKGLKEKARVLEDHIRQIGQN